MFNEIHITPIAFYIGPWPVHWYGIMYLIGFLAGWAVLSLRLRRSPRDFNQDQLSDIVFYTAMGAIIGGRLGYVLFYDTQLIFSDPLGIIKTWNGGMSFHGGLLGVLAALCLCCKKYHKRLLALTDLIAPGVPLGLGAGRLGNFINGELWGRVTDQPWGIIFTEAGPLPRHPSQLYELGLEGLLLFTILWIYSFKPRPMGAVSGMFALWYGIFRCFVEFFREPDAPIGFVAWGWMTEGQLLSIPLIMVGIILILTAYKRESTIHETVS